MRDDAQCGRLLRRRIRPAIRGLASIAFFAIIGPLSSDPCHADTDDGITLLLDHGATPADVVLAWTGGSPVYEVYRSADPAALVTAANKLGETKDQDWDDVPPPGVSISTRSDCEATSRRSWRPSATRRLLWARP